MSIRVLHLIAGLPTGGAEMMLYKLLARTRHESLVVSMTDRGPMAEQIAALGIPVETLGMRRGVPSVGGVLKLRRLLREFAPDVLQTWMYHADLLGGVTARVSGSVPVVWNIRQSTLDFSSSKPGTKLTFQVAAQMSRWLPDRIVCCSQAGERLHVAHGYPGERITLIPNGFDLQSFRPDPEARSSVRQELRLPDDVYLIGLVARFDPQKDHETFLAAAERLLEVSPGVHFLLCGTAVDESNTQLQRWVEATGHPKNFHLLGRRDDVPRLTAALDLATSSSYQEGFPNAVGEAMASGVACVVTDAGDSAFIVGRCGRVVPPRDPTALAEAWRALLESPPGTRETLGQCGRERIIEHFSLETVVEQYDQLYETMAERASCAA